MEKQFPEFSAVLFDMDGVIFDTEKVVVACWQEVAKKYGIPHIEDLRYSKQAGFPDIRYSSDDTDRKSCILQSCR